MRFTKEKTVGFFILATLMLTQVSCSPGPYGYYRPSAEDGTLVKWGSNLVGPANAIVLKNQGYELEVKYEGEIKLQLFVPEGKRIYLKDPGLVVYWEGDATNANEYKLDFDNYGFSSNSKEFVGRRRANIIQRNGTNYYTSINAGKWSDVLEVKLPLFETPNGDVIRFNNVVFRRKWGMAVMPIN